MIDINKIQTHSSPSKDTKELNNQTNTSNNTFSNPDQSFDFPPGYESYSKSSFQATINEPSDFFFPPGFEKNSFSESLPANFPKIPKLKESNCDSNNLLDNSNEQLQAGDHKLQPDPAFTINSEQQIPLNPKANICQIPSFSNIVYGIDSNESFQPHPKPDSSKYENLTLCTNLSSIQYLNQEKHQIESMISDEYMLCQNKINKFMNDIEQRNKDIEKMFQNLSQKISDCTNSQLSKNKFKLLIDDVVNTRNEVEIEKYLRENDSNNVFININNSSNENLVPSQETILDLLSILCRIYKKDKELALIWTKNVISNSTQVTNSTRLKPILLEIKRTMCSEEDSSAESKDISSLIDSKL